MEEKNKVSLNHLSELVNLRRFWSPSLTQRVKYILMIKPLLGLNQSMIKSERYSFLVKHYDPLSISIKIIELIIENTSIINIVDISGLTRDEIFGKITPFLKEIDKIKQELVNEEDQRYLVNAIIDSLVSTGRDTHQMEYIDYSDSSNCNWQIQPFRLLELDTTPDDEVNITVSLALVNIFTNILDMKIEDTHNAVLFMMEQQIKRGDIESAAKSSEHNLSLTLIYVKSLQEIIYKTKRKYQTIDWLIEYPKRLDIAKDHVKLCLDKESRIHNELIRKTYQYENLSHSLFYVKSLESNLEKSINMLLPLQNLIEEARDVFEIKSSQIFDMVEPMAFQIDSDFFPKLLQLPSSMVGNFLESSTEYFTSPDFPRILTLNNTVGILFKYAEYHKEDKKVIKRKKINRRLRVESMKKEKFKPKLRKKVINELEACFSKNNYEHGIKLSDILLEFRKNGFLDDELSYLRLVIQGRFASNKFEGRYLKRKLDVSLDNHLFDLGYFHGADFLVTPMQITKKEEQNL